VVDKAAAGCLALVSLLVSSCAAAASFGATADRACGPRRCISVSRFDSRLANWFDNNVAGYVALVGDTTIAAGLARTAANPPRLAMGPEVTVDIASVSKIFTTIAVLRVLGRRNLDVDARISPFLPKDWARGPGVDAITFRELLTHRAGFRMDSSRIFSTRTAARDQIRLGVSPAVRAQPEYNNMNFSIFRDLLPQLDGSAANFTAYIQREVFDPVGVRSANCGRVPDGMLMYPDPASRQLVGTEPPLELAACASGGWNLAVSDIRRVLVGLITGKLLTAGQRREMDDGCLGWDCSVVADQTDWRGKAGALAAGAATLNTYAAIAPGSLPVVIVINSPPRTDLETIVADSLARAAIH
jgi:CubicO group peptidase (beta-lactamase class C family)